MSAVILLVGCQEGHPAFILPHTTSIFTAEFLAIQLALSSIHQTL